MYLQCVLKSMYNESIIHDDNYSDVVQRLGFAESGPKNNSKKAARTGQKMIASQAATPRSFL